MVAAVDAAFMARALFLAERGRGRTSPNPIVGAVVVAPSGVVVGQGAHLGAGLPHAEIVALESAGALARGATLYCTLEPCSHTGRTGPCADAVIAAGVRRVVVAVADPNPQVRGTGLAKMRAAGLEVDVDAGREAALRQHAPFFTWIQRGRPLVIAKTAVSADGFVGRPGGRVKLTGAQADRHFHRQRAEVDAIAVGAGTVLADDPLLTARGAYRFRPLTRVVFDWRLRVPATARVFSTLVDGPVIMMVGAEHARRREDHVRGLAARGIEVLVQGTPHLAECLSALGARNLLTLLVEGGPALQQALFAADLVDRAQVVRTPTVLGTGVAMAPAFDSRDAETSVAIRTLGHDRLREFDVHRID